MLRPKAQFLNREARCSSWETDKAYGIPLWGQIPQKEKAGTMVPASSSCQSPVSEKDLPPLLSLRRFFHFLPGRLLFRSRFFCLLLRRGFFLSRFLGRFLCRRLGRRLWRRRLFLGLLADDHQLLFHGFGDLFRFARQFLVVFQP